MNEFIHALCFVFGAAILVGSCAAAATFGMAIVCCCMKWAPISVNVVSISRKDTDAGAQ